MHFDGFSAATPPSYAKSLILSLTSVDSIYPVTAAIYPPTGGAGLYFSATFNAVQHLMGTDAVTTNKAPAFV